MPCYTMHAGTAEAFSKIIHKELQTTGIPSKVEDLDKFDPETFKYVLSPVNALSPCRTHKLVILVVATTGEGDATDNARKFNRFITSKLTASDAFAGLKYAVFGLGDLNYINFNHMGKRTEINMDRLGAIKVYTRGIGDASQDIEADLRKWIDGGLIEAVRENVPNLTRTGSKPVVVLNSGLPDLLKMTFLPAEVSPGRLTRGSGTLSKVFWSISEGTVKQVKQLRQHADNESSTMEVTLSLPSDAGYHSCDSVEILPRNPPALVQWALKFFASDISGTVIDFEGNRLPFPTPCSVEHALEYYMDLSGCPSKTFLSNLAVLNRDQPELEDALYALAENGNLLKEMGGEYLVNIAELIDLFEFFFKCKLKLSLSEFFQIGPKQRVRAYTGASRLVGSDNEVRLVVALTVGNISSLDSLISRFIGCGIFPKIDGRPEWTKHRALFKGVCSDYLCHRVVAGDKVLLRVRESVLRPPSVAAPVLAIAAGAGIAPVMAYIDECEERGGLWFHSFFLVFGCQSSEIDFLYRDKILRLQEEGKLRCWFAFSREGNRKVYVQDIVRETRDIHKIINEISLKHGRIVVCGSTGMGRGVCEAIAAQIGGQAQLEVLEKSGKLVVEYFG